MRLSEIKKLDVPRDQNGVALRGVAREIALRKRQAGKEFKDYDITDNMSGVGKLGKIPEQALETKAVEDLWDESADTADYISTTTYQVRPIQGTKPIVYEIFSVVGDQKKPYGKFNVAELTKSLAPIRPNQTPDAEGFVTYVDPVKIEAFKYAGEPIKLQLDDKNTVQLSAGDYITRTVAGSSFKYDREDAATFEATLKKA